MILSGAKENFIYEIIFLSPYTAGLDCKSNNGLLFFLGEKNTDGAGLSSRVCRNSGGTSRTLKSGFAFAESALRQ